MTLIVVGLSVGHDCGAALMVDGNVVVAISEERIDRHRHSSGWTASLRYCLKYAGFRVDDVDQFVFSSGGACLPDGFHGGLATFGVPPERVVTVDHHLSHAIGAYCLSGYAESAVLVLDAVGNNEDTESFYFASRSGIVRLNPVAPTRPRYKGIGSTYEAFTNFLGFNDEESGKTMALAAYGDRERFRAPLFDLTGGGVKSRLEQTHQWGVAEFASRSGLDFGDLYPSDRTVASRDIAAFVQRQTEMALVHLVGEVIDRTKASALCLSGGVALNCVANSRVRAAYPDLRLFILPPASDSGQPLGNALYGHWKLTGEFPVVGTLASAFGREYDDDDTLAALRKDSLTLSYGRLYRYRHRYYKDTDPAAVAAQLLADGNVVGWFQGGSELGPRALGQRSILADPRNPNIRDVLNAKVKKREWFRPFSPSILVESAYQFVGDSVSRPFMVESPGIEANRRVEIPGAVHVDGSARVQTVHRSQGRFHDLIEKFAELTGVPAVVNTSFNVKEPIVETPGNALGTYLASEIDYLILGDYVVAKG
ncbi:carbamoyltransferase C-terminal domain-containing protein [Amycolatopsis sp. BJA-103]|uniref:carbamoyltransferase family protein n=1 Tax=Amycolatopsis sp. BJA-103 TaxID=1911175 RepID=UPI000C7758F3|nr:carbamoyltransferase C-terminal domain-containing protein [Amycolatopsis sp. BJA-103]AUI60411.1 hypothetical protein BKN51_20910 [Amycolatopsis sp. BJA-103]PNE16434.1 hypothetical protein B1H26_24545 [Amycolatopsis sp. BJA-103]